MGSHSIRSYVFNRTRLTFATVSDSQVGTADEYCLAVKVADGVAVKVKGERTA